MKLIGLLVIVAAAVAVWLLSGAAWTEEYDAAPVAIEPGIAQENAQAKQKHAYIGSKKCKKCHLKQYKSWEKTKMAKAFDLLKPGERADAKKKYGLDPTKDYTQDSTCLPCHTTGFGKKGGYAILERAKFKTEKAFKKAGRKAKALQGIGCEACHGPGSDYEKIHKEVLKSERKYKVAEFHKLGQNVIGVKVCESCHNEKNPTLDKTKPFDYEKRKEEGTHKHEKLKFRAEP